MYELKNKVVLITGGSGGIGARVVRNLLEENVKHVAILDIAEDNGIAFQNELRAKYGPDKVKFYKVDVTNEDQLFAAFNSVIAEHGYIDVVINNAGIFNDSIPVYKKEIQINLTAVVTSSLKALELMRKDNGGKGGTIVNMSSIAALCQTPCVPVYHATKTGVLQFGLCFKYPEYYALTGVRVLTICFDVTDTALFANNNMTFDKWHMDELKAFLSTQPKQSAESAARGVIDMYKNGENASVWLASDNKPVVDITPTVTKAYDLMEQTFKSL